MVTSPATNFSAMIRNPADSFPNSAGYRGHSSNSPRMGNGLPMLRCRIYRFGAAQSMVASVCSLLHLPFRPICLTGLRMGSRLLLSELGKGTWPDPDLRGAFRWRGAQAGNERRGRGAGRLLPVLVAGRSVDRFRRLQIGRAHV